jgi:hypothetical protein
MTPPLRLSFEVDCPPEHAFSVWTASIGTWWPPDHTVSGRAGEIVLERGEKSRDKLIRIEGLSEEELHRRPLA